MHDGGVLTWREVVEKHHSALVDELSERLDSELRNAVSHAVAVERSQATGLLARACDDARRSQAESLNLALRRLRHATGEEQILQLLTEGCALYAERSVVVVFESSQVRVASSQGVEAGSVSFDIDSAPAIISAIDGRDPIVALATETEISPVLATIFSSPADEKAYLFPISGRLSVVAMLIAPGSVVSAPIELLCEAAGMRLENILPAASSETSAMPHAGGLVQLSPGVPASATSEKRSWDELSSEDQKLHLQAQRTARVRIAEIRLYKEGELRSGVSGADIYGALKSDIDTARNQFLQSFLSKSPTMVDYLHLEILRSLAHDDDQLLGPGYPGPMV
jgi:hypothetical protein